MSAEYELHVSHGTLLEELKIIFNNYYPSKTMENDNLRDVMWLYLEESLDMLQYSSYTAHIEYVYHDLVPISCNEYHKEFPDYPKGKEGWEQFCAEHAYVHNDEYAYLNTH